MMFQNLAIFYLFLVPLCCVSSEENVYANTVPDGKIEREPEQKYANDNAVIHPIKTAITEFIDCVDRALKETDKDALPEKHNEVKTALSHIIDLMHDQSNIYKFIELEGITRVIQQYLQLQQTEIRIELLKLTQILFEETPTIASKMTPVEFVDVIFSIYVEDESIAVKTRAMAVLFLWLPENPKVQARLMRLKGLEPFYELAQTIDVSLIHAQLELFSKVIKDHLRIINNEHELTKSELSKLSIYKRMGLVERLTSKQLCHGLFDMFQAIWDRSPNKRYLVTVFEILTYVEPYCPGSLYSSRKDQELFKTLHNHVQKLDSAELKDYKELGVDVARVEKVLYSYATYVADTDQKDEL